MRKQHHTYNSVARNRAQTNNIYKVLLLCVEVHCELNISKTIFKIRIVLNDLDLFACAQMF